MSSKFKYYIILFDINHYVGLSIFRTSTEFFIDGTFNTAPRFGGQCQQLFVLMGVSYDVVSYFIQIQ